jgi:hypothetical protein
MLVYPRGGCGSTECHLFSHLLVCVFQADLEPVSGGTQNLLVSQCDVVWRSFVQAGGLGCWRVASFWWFFPSQVLLPCLSKIFDLLISRCLLPPTSHHIGSSSLNLKNIILYRINFTSIMGKKLKTNFVPFSNFRYCAICQEF